jgi:hypothetical protein
MRRRLNSFPVPPLLRLLILFAVLTIPLLASRVMSHFRGDAAASPAAPARSDLAKRS